MGIGPIWEITSLTFILSCLNETAKISKKADKGKTTVIMDTIQKIEEGLPHLSDDNVYKPLETPILLETALIVNRIVDKLFRSGNIDIMTHKWLTIGLKQPRIPESYTLTKIHKKIPVDKPIVSGSSGPTGDVFLVSSTQ